MTGRKPKPTKLKKIMGNPGKRPFPNNEIQPDPSIPEKPWWLDYFARKEWERLCPELHGMGILTKVDRTALVGYCMVYSRWYRAERELIKGFTYEYIDSDFKTKRTNKPEVLIARDALNQMLKFLTEFGLTPSSRARIAGISIQKKEKDIFDELLNYSKESTKGK